MIKTIDYCNVPEFDKDFKKLEKKYRTLSDDFESMKKNLLEVHYIKDVSLSPKALVDIKGFCGKNYKSKKVRKFACKSLKGDGSRSGIRVIFVLEQTPTEWKITFIEIYCKGDKENEDRERLKNFIKNMIKTPNAALSDAPVKFNI